jgi:hypothetical protein
LTCKLAGGILAENRKGGAPGESAILLILGRDASSLRKDQSGPRVRIQATRSRVFRTNPIRRKAGLAMIERGGRPFTALLRVRVGVLCCGNSGSSTDPVFVFEGRYRSSVKISCVTKKSNRG